MPRVLETGGVSMERRIVVSNAAWMAATLLRLREELYPRLAARLLRGRLEVTVGGPMSDVETRSVEMAELKAGIRLLAGHRVVLVVNGATGRKRYKGESAAAEEGGGKKHLKGTFRVGDHVLKAAAFRLHKDTGEGPLITPDTLGGGGSTGLRWDGDHWVTGDDGKYGFSGLPAGKYFVELLSDEGKTA